MRATYLAYGMRDTRKSSRPSTGVPNTGNAVQKDRINVVTHSLMPTTSRAKPMPRRNYCEPKLRKLRAQVAEAHGELFRFVATAHANGLLPREEIAEFKVLRKAGSERKLGRTTQAEVVLSVYRARSEEIASLLRQHGIEVPAAAKPRTAEVHWRRGTDTKRLAELDDSQLGERAKRLRIAVAMANGLSAAQALTKVGMPVTPASKRWAQRVAKAYSETGTVDDKRAGRSGAPITVLSGEMPALIEALWLRYRNATASGSRLAIEAHVNRLQRLALEGEDISHELLGPEIVAGRVRVPSTDTIQRVVQDFGPPKEKIRAQGWQEYRRQMRPTVELEWTTHANQEWQIDHTPLDVWARTLQDNVWTRVSVYLTAIIDVHSRAIVGAVVSARHPDAFTTALALRTAILPKKMEEWKARGIPERLVMDNGKNAAHGALTRSAARWESTPITADHSHRTKSRTSSASSARSRARCCPSCRVSSTGPTEGHRGRRRESTSS